LAKKSKSKHKQFDVPLNIIGTKEPPHQRKKFHHKDLIQYQPLTKNQRLLFDTFRNYKDKHLALLGTAGTGKTFSALFLALNEYLSSGEYDHIVIIRSCVASREIGYLPGTEEEKSAVYEAPYISICNELFKFSNSYESLKKLDIVNFNTSSFLRGTTFNNCIVIVDEIQNFSWQELDTIMTRIGKNSRLILCGDIKQNDLNKHKNDVSGFDKLYQIIVNMDDFEIIEFGIEDIVRSGFVKNYIIAKEKTGN